MFLREYIIRVSSAGGTVFLVFPVLLEPGTVLCPGADKTVVSHVVRREIPPAGAIRGPPGTGSAAVTVGNITNRHGCGSDRTINTIATPTRLAAALCPGVASGIVVTVVVSGIETVPVVGGPMVSIGSGGSLDSYLDGPAGDEFEIGITDHLEKEDPAGRIYLEPPDGGVGLVGGVEKQIGYSHSLGALGEVVQGIHPARFTFTDQYVGFSVFPDTLPGHSLCFQVTARYQQHQQNRQPQNTSGVEASFHVTSLYKHGYPVSPHK